MALTTPITVATFRQDFPEFGSTTRFPDSLVTFWLNVAGIQLNTHRWGSLSNLGYELFTAHHITLEAQNKSDANVGGNPGTNKGPVSSKAVDKVNISYDTNAAIELEAGHWNLTTYGTRFIRLAKMAGAGGMQATGGGCTPYLAPLFYDPSDPGFPE